MTPKNPNPDSNESQGGVLLALAARCEAATGPDRELDALIAASQIKAISQTQFKTIEAWAQAAMQNQWNYPRFTASLDAALTLVPAGMQWNYDSHYGMARIFRYWDGHEGPECSEYGAEGSTPALALTAASLRARSLSGEDGRA